MRSGRLFDLLAQPYALVTRHRVWEDHCARMALELPADSRRVLDLGCGPGNSTAHLKRTVGPGAVGADYAMSMLLLARRRDAGLPLLRCDASALPLRSELLDGVTLHSVLYLLRDRSAALREIARVLRPGGRVVLLEPAAGIGATCLGLLRALSRPRWALTAALWRTMSSAYGRFTPQELRSSLEAAGLRALSIAAALGGLGLLAVAEKSAPSGRP